MYHCRYLLWAEEQKHVTCDGLGPNVKKELWASDKKTWWAMQKKTWTGQAPSYFFHRRICEKHQILKYIHTSPHGMVNPLPLTKVTKKVKNMKVPKMKIIKKY